MLEGQNVPGASYPDADDATVLAPEDAAGRADAPPSPDDTKKAPSDAPNRRLRKAPLIVVAVVAVLAILGFLISHLSAGTRSYHAQQLASRACTFKYATAPANGASPQEIAAYLRSESDTYLRQLELAQQAAAMDPQWERLAKSMNALAADLRRLAEFTASERTWTPAQRANALEAATAIRDSFNTVAADCKRANS